MSKSMIPAKDRNTSGLIVRLVLGGRETPGPWFRGAITGTGACILISTLGLATGGLATLGGTLALSGMAWMRNRKRPTTRGT